MADWWPALALATAVALVVPAPWAAVHRLRGPAEGEDGHARWTRLIEPVPGACGAETRTRVAITGAAIGALVPLAGGAPGPALVVAPVLAGIAYLASGRIVAPAERRRRAHQRADLPALLELMASCLAAGLPVRGAAAAVAAARPGPLADDIDLVLAQIAIGDAESRAWRRLSDDPVWGPVARDLARSVESGTALVELLQSHADRARRERHARVVESARTVGVRSVLPLMTCYLPAFMLVGIVPIIAGAVPTLLG